jgi:hypothetical protein
MKEVLFVWLLLNHIFINRSIYAQHQKSRSSFEEEHNKSINLNSLPLDRIFEAKLLW